MILAFYQIPRLYPDLIMAMVMLQIYTGVIQINIQK